MHRPGSVLWQYIQWELADYHVSVQADAAIHTLTKALFNSYPTDRGDPQYLGANYSKETPCSYNSVGP